MKKSNRFKKVTGSLVKILIIMGFSQELNTSLVSAQQKNLTLSDAWTDGNGFTLFNWLRSEGAGIIYSSAVYIEVKQNTLTVYNTYKLDPFGRYARCGGLGCDLGKGQLISILNFVYQDNLFIVKSASGKAKFLQGAQCRVLKDYMKFLECKSTQNPTPNTSTSSIFRFAPGI